MELLLDVCLLCLVCAMKLVEIAVRGFRGIRECRVEGLADVNVFIGRNNSGKSSLLEALYLASAAFSYDDPLYFGDKLRYLLNRRCDRSLSWSSDKSILWHGYDLSSPIGIELMLGDKKLKISLYERHEHPLVMLGRVPGHEEFDAFCPICSRIYNTERMSSATSFGSEVFQALDDATGGFAHVSRFLGSMVFLDSILRYRFELVERALWGRLVQRRYDKVVVDVLRRGYGVEAEGLTYIPLGKGGEGRFELVVQLPDAAVRVDDLGDGARLAVIWAMAAALLRDSVLLLEDPEVHQHPGGLAKSLEALLELAKRNGIQVFMSTHSVELLRLLREVVEEKGISTRVFFLERSRDGFVDVRPLSLEDSRLLEDMGG